MQKSLATFMGGIIDYAGLFPPEQLSFYDAIHSFRRYRSHAQAAFIARFVIPVAQLPLVQPEIGEEIHRETLRTSWSFSVIGAKVSDAQTFLENLEKDVKNIRKFLDSFKQGEVVVDGYEIVFPQDLHNASKKDLLNFFADVQEIWSKMPGLARVFFELPYRDLKVFKPLIDALNEHNREEKDALQAKLRTGGLKPEFVPSAKELAEAIIVLNEAAIPFKCTAGLHQPLRHFDKDVGADVFGFLNVWGAAMVSREHNASLDELCKILTSTQKSDFQFASDKMSVMKYTFTNDDVKRLRSSCILSFGTCSFLEPVEYLQRMELL